MWESSSDSYNYYFDKRERENEEAIAKANRFYDDMNAIMRGSAKKHLDDIAYFIKEYADALGEDYSDAIDETLGEFIYDLITKRS